ncbi:formate/nitrite transporter family protein [Actinomycetaceae bacterium MB13-C1-2]|nr:formate/nitrite transporter family protein [Actinomycetaceae bacterium MB13-C1-2]
MSTVEQKVFPGAEFVSRVLDAADSKETMTKRVTRVFLMRAGMAGMLAGLFYLANFAVIAAFAQVGSNMVGVGRLLGAITFGFALSFIYYTGSELLTSNMMVTTIAVYFRRMKAGRATWILLLCFLGNAAGGLLVAILVYFSTLLDGSTGEFVAGAVDTKLGYITGGAAGIGDLFVRAILCNFMINLAMLLIYNGRVKSDGVKVVSMVVAVMVFAFLGFEHSVANTVLFLIQGLSAGIDVWLALANVGVVLVGNFVGGGLMIGLYYAYLNDSGRLLRPSPTTGEISETD